MNDNSNFIRHEGRGNSLPSYRLNPARFLNDLDTQLIKRKTPIYCFIS